MARARALLSHAWWPWGGVVVAACGGVAAAGGSRLLFCVLRTIIAARAGLCGPPDDKPKPLKPTTTAAAPIHTGPHTHASADWLERGLLQRLVLVVSSAATNEVLERWTFEVATDKDVLAGG